VETGTSFIGRILWSSVNNYLCFRANINVAGGNFGIPYIYLTDEIGHKTCSGIVVYASALPICSILPVFIITIRSDIIIASD
jgi:hypothetical protein